MIIELLNGTRFDISDYNLKRLYHYIPSASIEHNTVNVDGRSDIILNSKINNRIINVEFIYEAQDIFDYYTLRDELNALFLRDESYYIIFKNEPHKRWLVRCANEYNIQPNKRMESFNIEFITLNVYAESVATTQTLKEWDVDSWAWNGSIDWDTDLQYSFNTNQFVVRNLGNAIIDPRSAELEVRIRGNFEFGVTIRNLRFGTSQDFIYNQPLSQGEELVLTGIRTLKNDISAIRDTNKRLLSLLPGDNEIQIFGGEISNIEFNFRFLYK